MRSHIYLHMVWTTLARSPLIDAVRADYLVKYFRYVADQEHVAIVACGMVTTHVHVLVQTGPTFDGARLAQRFKGGSATIAGHQAIGDIANPLRWAKGYSVHSVSPRAVGLVIRYVERQDQNHPDEAIPGWRPVSSCRSLIASARQE